MFGIGYKLTLPKSEKDKLDEFAKSFPEKVQRRVFNGAGKKAAQALANRLQAVFPLGTKPHGFKSRFTGHLRDTAAFSMARHYKSGVTLFLVGYRSNENGLQTLFERGNFLTSPRRINHESNSTRKRVAGKMVRKREKYQRADGSWRYGPYKMVQLRDSKRSTGSNLIVDINPKTKRLIHGGSRDQPSRGDFPKSKIPFAPLGRAYKDMRGIVAQIMFSEVKAGLNRAFAKA